ncbi:TSC22 domain family protein 4 [Heteronotia binoei]|uniref:TSC22 domain family protein 4 n=1 Tax=Heteronotia binoei TaxID=13085 RepID=UPI0029309545|nr:TSC22 domain family protein 4 [Heteronotia binoei]
MSGGKKKSGFQITSVTSDYQQAAAAGEAKERPEQAGDGEAPPPAPNGPASLQAPGGSRFRVVKLAQGSGEPYKRGRWTCRDFYEQHDAQQQPLGGRLAESARLPQSLDSRLEVAGLLLQPKPAASLYSPQPQRRRTAPLPAAAAPQARSLGAGLPLLASPRAAPPSPPALLLEEHPLSPRSAHREAEERGKACSPLPRNPSLFGLAGAHKRLVFAWWRERPWSGPPGVGEHGTLQGPDGSQLLSQLWLTARAKGPVAERVRLSSFLPCQVLPRESRSRPSSPAPPLLRDASPSRRTSDPFSAARFSLARSMFGMGVAHDSDDDSGTNSSMIAIDNKIEQAMDLVKSHLMFAVREEVEVLREQIKELSERNALLEQENTLLRSLASADQLSRFQAQLHSAKAAPSSTST